jgi:hypothetical protein
MTVSVVRIAGMWVTCGRGCALDGDAVLVVTVNVLILKLTDFVNEDTKLVSDVRDIVVASLAPNGELLLCEELVPRGGCTRVVQTYCDLHALPRNQLHAAHDVLLHLDKL